MATYIKFIAGYLENNEYRYRSKNRLTNVTSFRAPKVHITDIASLEVASKETAQRLAGSIGGATLGGILFGKLGVLAGAVIGGRENETVAVITFRDGKKSLARLNAPMMELVRVHLFKLAENPNYAPFPYVEPKGRVWSKRILIAILIILAIVAWNAPKKKPPIKAPAVTQEQSATQDVPESVLHKALGGSSRNAEK